MKFPALVLALSATLLVLPPSYAADSSSASAAVTDILFSYDADEFASYVIDDDGRVDIVFARNTPDALYSEILGKLRNHPHIKGVLAGKSGPTCSRF